MTRPSLRGQSTARRTLRSARQPGRRACPSIPNASDLTVAVVGTGTMGRGIVQVSAQGGMRVIAYDEKPGAAQAAKDYIAKTLERPGREGPRAGGGCQGRRRSHRRGEGHGRRRQGQRRHRGHRRAARRQAGAVRQAGRRGRARDDPRLQHLVDPHHGHRLAVQAPRARRRHALLQSGAADAAGGDHSRPEDGAVGDGRHDGAGPAHDARAGAVHRQPGVPRQSRRPRLRAGVAAHPDREHRRRRRHRPHPHRRARASRWGRSRWPTWSASTSSTA